LQHYQIDIFQGRYGGEMPHTETEARKIYCQYISQLEGALPLRGMDRKESDAGSRRNALSLAVCRRGKYFDNINSPMGQNSDKTSKKLHHLANSRRV